MFQLVAKVSAFDPSTENKCIMMPPVVNFQNLNHICCGCEGRGNGWGGKELVLSG